MPHAESFANPGITTTSETVAASINGPGQIGIQEPGIVPPPVPVVIRGLVVVGVGTGATSVSVRCRAQTGGPGSTVVTGTQIGQGIPSNLIGGQIGAIPFEFFDPSGIGTNTGYAITVAQIAATGNGNIPAIEINMEPQ